jgi:hypothetical protein
MSVRGGIYLVSGWLLSGCGGGLDAIQGFDLGNPKSAVWTTDEATDRVMVVAADQDDLCTALSTPDGAVAGQWTMSVWSTEAARYEVELAAEAVVSIRDGVLDDDFQGDGTIEIDDSNGDLQVRVDLDFGEDQVKGVMKAEPCDFTLFAEPTGQTQ